MKSKLPKALPKSSLLLPPMSEDDLSVVRGLAAIRPGGCFVVIGGMAERLCLVPGCRQDGDTLWLSSRLRKRIYQKD